MNVHGSVGFRPSIVNASSVATSARELLQKLRCTNWSEAFEKIIDTSVFRAHRGPARIGSVLVALLRRTASRVVASAARYTHPFPVVRGFGTHLIGVRSHPSPESARPAPCYGSLRRIPCFLADTRNTQYPASLTESTRRRLRAKCSAHPYRPPARCHLNRDGASSIFVRLRKILSFPFSPSPVQINLIL